jgi:ATP-dependent helicase/nuclease subunit A
VSLTQQTLFDLDPPAPRRLSEEQLAAIGDRAGSLALAANAGSGKTSVLVERFVRAVREDGVAPSRILAITFTDRAAGELRARVRAALLDAGLRAAAQETTAAPISTFHAFALRLLRAHPLLAAVPPEFVVLDDAEAAALREQAFREALSRWQERPGALDLAATFGIDDLRGALLAVFDERRSRGEEEPRLPEPPVPPSVPDALAGLASAAARLEAVLAQAPATASVHVALDRLERCEELLRSGRPTPLAVAALKLTRRGSAFQCPEADAYDAAREALAGALADAAAGAAIPLLDELLVLFTDRFALLKQRRGGADFDDLELAAARLLREHPDLAAAWRERFELLMIDELQDTNARQMELIAALDRDNLFTVGDAFQSIYGFRHASVAGFRERQATLAARGRALVLSANYRSRSPILAAANRVFAPLFGPEFVALRPGRADAGGGPAVELLVVDTEGWQEHAEPLFGQRTQAVLWRTAEARLLAARVSELIDAGEAAPADIAVLLRYATDIAIYERELAARGHATLTPAGAGFYARPEIVDLTAFIVALANPLDELALYGALASPLGGAGPDDLVELARSALEQQITPWEALAGDPRLAGFARRFSELRVAAAALPLGGLVARILDEGGYERYLCQLAGAERRVANVRKLVRLAREFEHRHGRDLRCFADALSAGRIGSLHESEAPPPLGDAIRLMTVHAAKGLEFPVVCVADLGHRPNNDLPRLLTDGVRVGLRLPTIERKSVDSLDYAEIAAERRTLAVAEEQRVFYVAMTRARERLILSGAARFAAWPSPAQCPLAWLGPALAGDIAARAGAGECDGELVDGVRLTLARATALAATVASPGELAEPASPAPVAVPAAALPSPRLSYTALAEYERCAYRYYLQRILGLPDVAPPPGSEHGEGAAARGTLVHALLERLDFADPREPDPATVAATAAALGVDAAANDAARLAGAFARSPLCARLAVAEAVRREEPFALLDPSGEGLLRGTFDVLATEADGTVLIVDFKTDSVEPGADLDARVERDYSLQRLVYALAALSTGAERVEVAHCFLQRPERLVSARFDAAQLPALTDALAQRIAPLRAGAFPVTAAPGRERCATCPGRARLCSYEESVTLRA